MSKGRYPDFDPHRKLRGIHIPLAVDSDERLSDGAKRLYGHLQYCWGSPKDGRRQICNPGSELLQNLLRASDATVERYLKELRQCDYIRTVKHGPGRSAEHYFLENPRLLADLKRPSKMRDEEPGPDPSNLRGEGSESQALETVATVSHHDASPLISEANTPHFCSEHPSKMRVPYKEEEKSKEKSKEKCDDYDKPPELRKNREAQSAHGSSPTVLSQIASLLEQYFGEKPAPTRHCIEIRDILAEHDCSIEQLTQLLVGLIEEGYLPETKNGPRTWAWFPVTIRDRLQQKKARTEAYPPPAALRPDPEVDRLNGFAEDVL